MQRQPTASPTYAQIPDTPLALGTWPQSRAGASPRMMSRCEPSERSGGSMHAANCRAHGPTPLPLQAHLHKAWRWQGQRARRVHGLRSMPRAHARRVQATSKSSVTTIGHLLTSWPARSNMATKSHAGGGGAGARHRVAHIYRTSTARRQRNAGVSKQTSSSQTPMQCIQGCKQQHAEEKNHPRTTCKWEKQVAKGKMGGLLFVQAVVLL